MPGAPGLYLGDEQQRDVSNSSTQQQQQTPLLPQQKPTENEETERSPSRSKGPGLVIWAGISYLSSLAFMGLVIYALVVSDTDSVTNACGRALWNFLCFRLCFAIFEAMSMCFFGRNTLIGDERGGGRIEGAAYGLILAGIFHIILLGVGAFYVSQAMNNETCRNALASVSATNSPLLGILEYVYVALDAFLILSIACVIFLALDDSMLM